MTRKKLPLFVCGFLLNVFLCLPALTHAQLWISFGVASNSSNSCYANLSWSVADLSTTENYAYITRSNDGGSTFNVIAIVAVPSANINNGTTWTSSYTDTDPYGGSSSLYTNGANTLEYRVYFIKDDGVNISYSNVAAISSLPMSKGSCSGLGNPCSGNSSTITGPSPITTATSQFSVTSNEQVTWAITGSTPSGIATIQANKNPSNPTTWTATLTATGNGSVTITAYFPVCGTSINETITINDPALCVPPPAPGITISGIEPLNHGTQMDVSVSTTAPTPYLWYVNGTLVFTAYTASATINGGSNCNVLNTLMVQVSNSCGSSSSSTHYTRPCSGAAALFTVSPNPASGTVTVTATADTPELSGSFSKTLRPNRIYQLRVLDKFGNIRKIIRYPAGATTTTIDLSSLGPDVYTVQVYNNGSWTSKPLVLIK